MSIEKAPVRSSIASAAITSAFFTRSSCRSVNSFAVSPFVRYMASTLSWRTLAMLLRAHHQHFLDSNRNEDLLFRCLRRGGGGRRNRQIYATETTTMIVIGIILSFVSLAFLCWLLFALLCAQPHA